MYIRMRRTTFRKLKLPEGPSEVEVGFPKSKVNGSVIERAIYNEFGTKGGASGGGWGGPIPERPFFRNAMRANQKRYNQLLKISAKKILSGETTLRAVLTKLGIVAQGNIQEEITKLKSPPNSPVTVERKGSSNPLIDTGEMRQAVTWRVKG